jgi:hypothetical protein
MKTNPFKDPLIYSDIKRLIRDKIADREIWNSLAQDRVTYKLGGKKIIEHTIERIKRQNKEILRLRKLLEAI